MQELRLDEGEDGALDRAAAGEGGRAPCRRNAATNSFSRHEKIGADVHLVVLAIDVDALRPARTHSLATSASCCSICAPGERLAAQPAAADRAAAEREVDARIVELGQDRLLDLIERQRPAGDAVRQPLERARNLPDALVADSSADASRNRVVVDDRSQHQRVVRVQPEGDLVVLRQLVSGSGGQEIDVTVELRAIRLQGAVVNLAVADVEVENRDRRSSGGPHRPATPARAARQWSRRRERA